MTVDITSKVKFSFDETDCKLFFWILRHIRKQGDMDSIFNEKELEEMDKRRDIWEDVFRAEVPEVRFN